MRVTTIDTRHGTANQNSYSNGNCLPFTGVPFGMNYFAPQTNDSRGSWWFHPDDRTFQGFRLTHQPSPWMGDFSSFTLLPVSGHTFSEHQLFHGQSSYRPETSTFHPHYLEIEALRYNYRATLVPSMYGGLLTIDYRQADAGLLLHLPGRSTVTLADPHTLQVELCHFTGCEDPNFTFYFTLHFDEPLQNFEKSGTYAEATTLYLEFGTIVQQMVRFGTSFISAQQATWHFEQERALSATDFLEASAAQWENYLSRIDVRDPDSEQVATFYHNLYRAFLFPQTFYEVTPAGEEVHYNTTAQKVQPGKYFTNNGFWDTCRTVYPLYSLIAAEKYGEFLEGFLNHARETKYLPKWLSPDERGLMPGTLIDAVIADAAIKDIRRDLMPEFLEAMLHTASVPSGHPHYGRSGTRDFTELGYVPANYHESINHTLDYCYSDFCISQVAATVGNTAVAQQYQQTAQNYHKIFDSAVGFMRAKDANGQFVAPFDAYRWGRDTAEGSAWQSSFAVFHDIAGLIDDYGGREAFTQKLITLCNQEPRFHADGYGFEIHEMSEMAAVEFGQLALSNQPSFHLPYLFAYAGHPEYAQPLLKQLMTQLFDASPQGFPGDEDNGSMASWYLFSALGFYPVCPGSGEYVRGIPLFEDVRIQLSNGERLLLTASPTQPQQQFVAKFERNQAPYSKLYLKHNDLLRGGHFHAQLGIVPQPQVYHASDYPFSLRQQATKNS